MPKKLSEEERQKRESLKDSQRAVGVSDAAKKRPVEEDSKSILGKTSTIHDELEKLNAIGFSMVNLEELEMRIGLMARIILEHAMRTPNMTAKDKCDVALRAITVLEGSKQEVTWRDELRKKPQRRTLEAFQSERAEKEERLKRILLRRKEVQLAQAEDALSEIKKDESGNGETTH